jgi:4-amino-4-deoxy-L-arabinose transferase-like glycosyltransferase
MRLHIPESRRVFLVVTLAVICGGFILWISDLTSDPPMYFSGMGQSLSTDPAQYINHARSKILFDAFDPFDYNRWTVYQHSITSLVAYFWMSVMGVSMAKANAVGVFFCFGALIFLVAGVRRYHSAWVSAAVAFCFVINITLLTHGRLTYLENGLLFLAAMAFYVFLRWGQTNWGIALTGALIAAAMITGKLFGAVLLPATLLAVILSKSDNKWRQILTCTAAFLISTFVLLLILYGGNLGAAFGYVGEQSYGLRGFPAGLSSPWGFVEHLVSYGFRNRLFYLNPDIFLFLLAGSAMLLFFLSTGRKLRDLSPVVLLAICWAVVYFLALMPLNYSPIRYTLILLPVIIIGCFGLLDQLHSIGSAVTLRLTRWRLVIVGLSAWMLTFHFVGNVFFFNVMPVPVRGLTWGTLPIAAGLTLLIWKLVTDKRLRLRKQTLTIALLALLVCSGLINSLRIKETHFNEHNFNILEANRDVSQILGPEAVVSGPYGPVLTVDTDLKSFIHLFGVASVDTTLFDHYPVTHLAVDASNWKLAVAAYPKLATLQPITSYWIRDYEVYLYNISKIFGNSEANAYRETDYERALQSFSMQQPDSALALAQQFYQHHPDSKSGGILLIDLLSNNKRFADVQTILTSLANRYPTDFFLQVQCGRFLQLMAHHRKNDGLLVQARRYYEKAAKVNPFKAAYASNVYAQTARQFSGNAGTR